MIATETVDRPNEGPPTKKCIGECGRELPATIDYFGHYARRPDGTPMLRNQCRICHGKLEQQRYRTEDYRAHRRGTYKPKPTREPREPVEPREQPEPIRKAPRVPTRPLALLGMRLARRLAAEFVYDEEAAYNHAAMLMGVHSRTLYSWRVQARQTVDVDSADDAAWRVDALWWDVFNEDTVRTFALEVGHFTMRKKRVKSDNRKRKFGCPCLGKRVDIPRPPSGRYRERVGTTLLGDLGPDRETLAAVERAFTGEDLGEPYSEASVYRLAGPATSPTECPVCFREGCEAEHRECSPSRRSRG
jgi:hypothetical protein